jgi:hypothetical protein
VFVVRTHSRCIPNSKYLVVSNYHFYAIRTISTRQRCDYRNTMGQNRYQRFVPTEAERLAG